MLAPDWKLVRTVQKRIRISRVNAKDRNVDAFDLDAKVPVCLIAALRIDLDKIKRAKIYQATIKVFEAELTPELEHQLVETAIRDFYPLRDLQAIKSSGAKPTKLELIALTH